MKSHFFKSFNPKHLLKKSRSLSKSAPASFGSASYSSSSSSSSNDHKVVHSTSLPNPKISSDWSDNDVSSDLFRFDYVQAFKMMDRDGDGKITSDEIESILRKLGGKSQPVTAEEVAALIGEIDSDGDGCISLDELRTVESAFEPKISGEDELREVFDVFDSDRDGKIGAHELQEVFVSLGDDRCTLADCRRMIAEVDKNRDGFVCFDDFTRMMTGLQR